MVMAILLSLSPKPPKTHQNPNPDLKPTTLKPISLSTLTSSRRYFILNSTSLCSLSSTLIFRLPISIAETLPSKSILSGIASTKSWSQFYGAGFAIRVPPQFEDMTEPEDYNAGLSLYGDKAKTKKFAAQFASPDGSEVVSILIRPSNQLKITFLEAKDITDLGTLKEAAKIFVPGGSSIYSARTIKIKEDESFKTYYFYEFGRDGQHVALVAAVNSGKAIVAAASATESKWEDDGVKLRSAALENIVNSIVHALVQCVDEMKKSGFWSPFSANFKLSLSDLMPKDVAFPDIMLYGVGSCEQEPNSATGVDSSAKFGVPSQPLDFGHSAYFTHTGSTIPLKLHSGLLASLLVYGLIARTATMQVCNCVHDFIVDLDDCFGG